MAVIGNQFPNHENFIRPVAFERLTKNELINFGLESEMNADRVLNYLRIRHPEIEIVGQGREALRNIRAMHT